MAANYHEIRDPIHGFIIFNDLEKDIINSPEFQRLKEKQKGQFSTGCCPNENSFERSLKRFRPSEKGFGQQPGMGEWGRW